MAWKLRFFREHMTKAGISPSGMSLDFDDVEIKLRQIGAELVEVNTNNERLERTYNELLEYNLVLQKVRREKSIYHTLNMLSLDVTKKCLVGEGWSPVFATGQIQEALKRAATDSNSQVGSIFQVLHTREHPPRFFRTNKFTTAFHEIVDAYGVAKYQEANPGVYTIVTFPFLFAVMFGD